MLRLIRRWLSPPQPSGLSEEQKEIINLETQLRWAKKEAEMLDLQYQRLLGELTNASAQVARLEKENTLLWLTLTQWFGAEIKSGRWPTISVPLDPEVSKKMKSIFEELFLHRPSGSSQKA